MEDVAYDKFIAEIYDDSPCFGKARSSEPDKFNGFYLRELSKPQTILEFGSGTGPLTIPLARMGHKIDSVDISNHMHNVIKKKLKEEPENVRQNINLIEADALTFSKPEKYQSLVMPEGIIIALPDATQQVKLLQSCNRNLVVGGRIYFDFFQPNYKVIYNKTVTEHTRFRTKSGVLYILSITYENEEYSQIQGWYMTYTRIVHGIEEEKIKVFLQFRYIFYSELLLLLEKCGFQPIDIDITYADRRGFSVIAEKTKEL